MQRNRPIEILLVEDNPGDVRLTIRAIQSADLPSNISVVHDGAEAIDFLYQQGKYTNASRPNLILLDLNLPKKSGDEVLSVIKKDPELLRIPVVVLTSSEAEEDILQSYNLHANSYVTKPSHLQQFMSIGEMIRKYWLATAELPPA